MGVYDTVVAKCVSCGAEHHFQSKAGPCTLQRYVVGRDLIPSSIAWDLNGSQNRCDCGNMVDIRVNTGYSHVQMETV